MLGSPHAGLAASAACWAGLVLQLGAAQPPAGLGQAWGWLARAAPRSRAAARPRLGPFTPGPPVVGLQETGTNVPSTLSPAQQQELVAMATASLKAMGLTHGIQHTELKYTSRGARLLEVGAGAAQARPGAGQRDAGSPAQPGPAA